MRLFQKMWGWAAEKVIREVPQDEALCEFDCRKPQCKAGEWESCNRRLQRAAGELMPSKRPASMV